jgi:hypothetical protein
MNKEQEKDEQGVWLLMVINEIWYSCLLFGVAASMVLWHRLRVKNIETINPKNLKRSTIRAAMPNNDNRGIFL